MLNSPSTRAVVAALLAVTALVTTSAAAEADIQGKGDPPVYDDGENIGGDVRSQLAIVESGSSGGGGGTPPPCRWTDDEGEEHDDGVRRWRLTAVDQQTWGDIYDEWDIEQGVVYRYECIHPSMCDGDLNASDCYGDLLYGEGWCGSAICYFDAISPPALAVMLVEDSFLERLGPPEPQFSPPGGTTIVNFDTWLWVDNVPADGQRGPWSISVPGPISVEASASLSEVVWDMGDGNTVTCPITTDEASAERDCSYAYEQSSAGEPGDEFQGSVSVVWTVDWDATVMGQQVSNTIEAPREAEFSIAVAEGQAVVVDR